jgi:hypothetical protein
MIVRQGDVLITRLASRPSNLASEVHDPRGGVVLAEGETSGHHHQVFGRGAKLFAYKGPTTARVLVVGRAGAEVRVEGGGVGGVPRHHPVMLKGGSYEVRVQRSWSAEQERAENVVD